MSLRLFDSDSESRDSYKNFDGNLFGGFGHPDSANLLSLAARIPSSGEAGQPESGASEQGLLVSGESSSQESREMNHHNYRTIAAAPAYSEEYEKMKHVEVLKENFWAAVMRKAEANIDTKLLMPDPILLQCMSQRRDYDGVIALFTSRLRVLEPAGQAGQVDQP